MALVPADSALEVTKAIKNKYSTEMGRVHDRLPLHLGLVFAPRHTPLSAVLEAGRAMLNMPTTWEEWQIATIGHKATFSRNGRTFEWEYPAQMGDEQTQDIWYPHLLVVDPTVKPDLSLKAGSFRPVDNLTDTVYIRPSRFDFVFLDTTARCFEIAYQTSEIFRASHHPRPFLLNDLDRLEKLWEELCQLEKSQRHQVIASIEATRESWFGDDGQGESLTDGVFRQFVRDTLAGAAWPNERTWQAICKDKKDKDLENAGVTGELADLAELHTQILKE
jgi:hypothetical protein